MNDMGTCRFGGQGVMHGKRKVVLCLQVSCSLMLAVMMACFTHIKIYFLNYTKMDA